VSGWLLVAGLAGGAVSGGQHAEREGPVGLVRWAGGPTPPLTLEELSGGRVALGSLRGRTVVVNFWATWCEPCRAEMPSLERLRAQFPAGTVAVLTVDVGESPERVRTFLAETGVKLPVLLDPQGETAGAWKVVGFPSSFVIGPDGRIRYRFVGELDWMRADVVRTVGSLQPGGKTPAPPATSGPPGSGKAKPAE
jgi:thiol-disulfide isomerase/thioredoxin